MEKHPLSLESKINGDGEVEETNNDNNESLKKYFEAYYGYISQPIRQKEKEKKKKIVEPTKMHLRSQQKLIYYNIDY